MKFIGVAVNVVCVSVLMASPVMVDPDLRLCYLRFCCKPHRSYKGLIPILQNQGIRNVEDQNGLSVVSKIANQHGNGNVVTTSAEGNGNGINGNMIMCYNCQGDDHYASNYTVKPRKQDDAYLQKQMQIAQKKEAGIQLTSEEFDFMAVADRSAEEVSSVEQGEGTVEQHPANVEETHALYDSLYNNLAIEVEKVNTVNRKLRETNADLTTELARYKNQEKCFEISQE
nr:hypothetical protein [Tanacetum cinerariifolium]